jgi:hypothetical protein
MKPKSTSELHHRGRAFHTVQDHFVAVVARLWAAALFAGVACALTHFAWTDPVELALVPVARDHTASADD